MISVPLRTGRNVLEICEIEEQGGRMVDVGLVCTPFWWKADPLLPSVPIIDGF
jgi:hypothetical protein